MSALDAIPGYGAFADQVQRNQQQGSSNLAQALTLMKIREEIASQQQGQDTRARNEELRAAIAALPPHMRTREHVLPLLLKHGAKEAIPAMLAEEKGEPIGSGGLLKKGVVIPPAARPTTQERWSEPYTLNGALVQKNEDTGQVRTAVTREPREPQIRIEQPPPVTTSDVVDPKDPTRMLKIDARTYRGGSLGDVGVLGVSGKVSEEQKLNQKRQISSQGVADAIERARDILTGKNGQLPTASGVGNVVDTAASFIGVTPPGAAQADKLKVIGSMLVQKVPRFEGPQSNLDVQFYKESAGKIGDPNIPIERRLAALEEVENIWGQFEAGKKSGYFKLQGPTADVPPQDNPGAPPAAATPTAPPTRSWDATKERRYQELKKKREQGASGSN